MKFDQIVVNNRSRFWLAFLAIWTLFSSGNAEASSGITYHGRILKPDGNPLESATVQFRLQVRSPGTENCLLYEERQTKNLNGSGGVFSITLNDGTGSRAPADEYASGQRLSLERVFQNKTGYPTTLPNCDFGTIYQPNPADGRKFQVYFRDATMTDWEPMQAQMINYVPFALEAKSLSGFTPQNLLRVEDSSGPQSANALTPAQFAELEALTLGNSAVYMKTSANGAQAPVRAGDPASPAAGQFWFDTGSSQLKYYDGTQVQVVGGSGGALPALTSGRIWVGNGSNAATAVQMSGDATLSNAGALTLKNTGTAGSYFQVTTDAQGRVTSGSSSLIEANIPTLTTAGKVLGSAINTGLIGGDTAINTTGNITSAALSSNALYLNGNGNQIRVAASSSLGGNIDFVLPPTNGANGNVLTTNGAGVLSWSSPSASSQWTTNGNDIAYTVAGGNVGIGVAAPTSPLSVDRTVTSTSPSFHGISNVTQYAPTATSTGSLWGARNSTSAMGTADIGGVQLYGAYNQVWNNNSNATSTGDAKGTYSHVQHNGAGQMANGTGVYASTENLGAGVIVNATGVRAEILNSGTGSILNGYGVYIGSIPATNKYGLYQADAAASNFFAGNVGIGVASPAVSLDLSARKDAVGLPSGNNTTERPATPAAGMFRYNVTDGVLEYYNGSWRALTSGGSSTSVSNVSTISNTGGITLTAGAGQSVLLSNGTSSLSPTSGALVVTGGAGISGNANIGGNIVSNGSISATNATAATSGANQNSPSLYLSANYWNGTATAVDQFSITNLLGTGTNPTATLTFDRAAGGTSGLASYAFLNGRVGIGTATPQTRLDVESSAWGAAAPLRLRNSSSNGKTEVSMYNDWNGNALNLGVIGAGGLGAGMTDGNMGYLEHMVNGPFAFTVNSAERMRITAAGDLAIGRTTASAKLDVNGEALVNKLSIGSSQYADLNVVANGTIYQNGGDAFTRIQATGGGNARVILQSNGSGGTATPQNHEMGRIDFGGNDGSAWIERAATIAGVAEANFTNTANPTALTFSTTATNSRTEKMRITGDGKVGIGTSSPGALLTVNGGRTNISALSGGIVDVLQIANQHTSTTQDFGVSIRFRTNSTIDLGEVASAWSATSDNTASYMKFMTRTSSNLTEKMRIDSAGNVGIGTTAPTAGAILDLNGTGPSKSSMILPQDTTANRPTTGVAGMFRYNTSTFSPEWHNGSGWFSVASNNAPTFSQYITISSNASNTAYLASDASNALPLAANGGLNMNNTFALDATGSFIRFGATNTASTSQKALIGAISNNAGTTPTIVFGQQSGASAYTERMRIDGSGNVGIGTATPAQPLDVVGNIRGSSAVMANGAMLAGNGSAAAPGHSFVNYSGSGVWYPGSNALAFSSGAAERVRIDSSGNVGVGTASPSARLHVSGGDAMLDLGAFLNFTGTSGHTAIRRDGALLGMTFRTASTQRMIIDDSGNVGIGTATPSAMLEVAGSVKATSFITTSDRRLKTEIREIKGWDLIRALQGVRYRMKSSGDEEYGLIAQDVERIMPEAVVTDAKTGFKGVKYQALISPLIEAVKETRAMCEAEKRTVASEIESLKNENKEMRAELDELKAMIRELKSERRAER